MGLWVGVELGSHASLTIPAVVLVAFLRGGLAAPRDPPGYVLTIQLVVTALAMATLARLFLGKVRREGLSSEDLRYDLRVGPLGVGAVMGGAVIGALLYVAEPLDRFLFGQPEDRLAGMLREAGWGTAVLLLAVNGAGVPVVEEFAWRGYIQTRMLRVWGWWGVVVTALAFAAKHVIVDFWLGRTTVLVVASLLLGLIGVWWGTGASTTAHLVMNSTATAWFVIETLVLGRQ
ncbi:MAG: CPBP family intramembrane glutamic endopeptidase [Armatimonadota bacterium]|nr:CPBP family intramembrane glutamic endopeptidase [Armatimonadota bacterium]MDR7487945.1 CPBP family intramembrane glutamic endopeptidase [Armatimonadota bacterium]MDR7528377.1 CPBP family intramembrane glutamic endopeptidase [Armatimonadota bacterium]MDR7574521.1 CPBP family intramembrane glutamic endopeptidase [Armatimonadota bacterium]MDR7584368.1 CPBP family intramembrane glutamic endopeptidase [Armatimonadota bacterium]